MDVALSEDSGASPARFLRSYALHDAAETGDARLLKEIIEYARQDQTFGIEGTITIRNLEGEGAFDIDEVDDDECSALHVAILKGHVPAVETLLAFGADIKLACEGSPPLHLAVCSAAHKHREDPAHNIIKLLLGCGASAVQRDDNGRTAFHWAAWLGLKSIMETIAAAFQEQAAQDAENLQKASEDAGMELTPQSELPNVHTLQDKQGNTALHLAASSHSPEAVRQLLLMPGSREAAAVINKNSQTPLHLASATGVFDSVLTLLQAYPEGRNLEDKLGQTPLLIASHHKHTALEILLRDSLSQTAAAPDCKQGSHTLLSAPPACRQHRTAPEPIMRGADLPPENVKRLHVLTDTEDGILRTSEFDGLQWDEINHTAPLADVLKVHEWTYIRQIQRLCSALPDDPAAIGQLDPDTALSRGTWQAALAGVGACCHAIDSIMAGKVRNAFCAIRPPGHHAGPLGTVTSALDPHGSQGFCFLNNIAIAGAYAVNAYRHQGIRRIALLDFDVHHGNGTQACVGRVVPQVIQYPMATPLCEGSLKFQSFHPWFDEHDVENILFASVQGFGKKPSLDGGYVYPGSGATCDTTAEQAAQRPANGPSQAEGAEPAAETESVFGDVPPNDPDMEFRTIPGHHPPAGGPRIINVGIPGPGTEVAMWRRAWRDKILPAVANFKPDFIIISAGFDAHKKDELNYRFIGVTERDYYWLTQQLVSLANTVCKGRIVSALEGGYRIQGRIVSAFSRSVAAHVRALSETNKQEWSLDRSRKERAFELRKRRELIAIRKANALKAAERAAERQQALATALALAQQGVVESFAASQAASSPGLTAAAAVTGVAEPGDIEARIAESADPALQESVMASPDTNNDRRKRRRGAAVDYAALDLQLKQEQRKAKEGAKGPLSNEIPPSQPLASTAIKAQPLSATSDGLKPISNPDAQLQ